MKKMLILALVFAIGLVFVPQAVAQLEFSRDKFEVVVRTGFGIPTEDLVDIDIGTVIEGAVLYEVHKNVNVGVQFGWEKYDVELLGDARLYPLLGIVEVRPNGERQIQPYAKAGIGVTFVDFENSALLKEFGDPSVDADEAFTVQVGGGIDVEISENVALNFEAVYSIAESDVTFGSTTADVNLDRTTVTAGLRYSF